LCHGGRPHMGPGFRRDEGEFADAFFKQADRIPAVAACQSLI
jgi:hypothetical protein